MAILTGFDVGRQVCRAIGLEAHKVTRIDINISSNEILTVKVEVMLDGSQGEAVTKIFEAVEWKEQVRGPTP